MPRVTAGLLRALVLGLPILAFAAPGNAIAQAAPPEPTAVSSPDALRPGQYRWHADDAPADAPVRILVSLPLQRAYVFRGGVLIGFSTVSTGQPGYDTPTGTFTILQKKVHHRSNLYDDAPMPYMQRLTWDGIALHAGEVADSPASHGCIRLPAAFARRLFAVTALGTSVTVTDLAPSAPEEAAVLATAG